jgi:phosphoglycolate phosphatase-like HAD superfamily hydrolase
MNLVMFDIDGTLTQSDHVDTDCFVQAAREVLNLPRIDCEWSHYRHVTDSGIATELIKSHFGRMPIPGELECIRDRFIRLLHEALFANSVLCRPTPGASKMLTALSARGDVTLALATGGWEQSARLKLRSAGFQMEGIAVASADDSFQREQIIAIAQVRALQRCRIKAFDSLVYVGDGLWDLQASRRLGIPFIAVANGEHAQKLRSHGADLILPDFRDYGRFLEMLQSVRQASCDRIWRV